MPHDSLPKAAYLLQFRFPCQGEVVFARTQVQVTSQSPATKIPGRRSIRDALANASEEAAFSRGGAPGWRDIS
jgi:hypothetical protein